MTGSPTIGSLRQMNMWDSFNPHDLYKSADRGYLGRGEYGVTVRLFGSTNVGRQERTNLLTCWTGVPSKETHIIQNWYARTNIHTPPAEFLAFASSSTVEFNVGDRPRDQLPLADLLQGRHGWLTPEPLAIVPERQNYDVTIISDRRALAALLEVLPNIAPESLIWVHLEGVCRREVTKSAEP